MDFFITRRIHEVNHPDIVIVNSLTPLFYFLEEVSKSSRPQIGFDKEFNGLNELINIPLLTQIGNMKDTFVIDDISFPDLSYLNDYQNLLYIGHNIKIDVKTARKQGADIRNVWDTMLVEQRLGLDSKRKNTLEATHERRLGERMPFKHYGKEDADVGEASVFNTMNEKSIFKNEHILYSGGDIKPMIPIKMVQEDYLNRFNMGFLAKIENKVLPILADGELEGLHIYEDKWRTIIKDNREELVKVEQQLDSILEDMNLIKKRSPRIRAELTQHSIFDEIPDKVVEIQQKSRTNYSSSPQMLGLFDALKLSRPKKLEKKKNKLNGSYEYVEIDSVGEPELQKFILEKPEAIINPFLDVLIQHKGIEKEINSFGERFLHSRVVKKDGSTKIGYKNDKTGKVHTIYKQCTTTTGRLSSGDSDNGFYNSQQIPAIPKYRECFGLTQEEIDNDWWITTSDLTGAEVTIMCAFAKDPILYKWAVEEDDLHSPLATRCWQEVARQRVRKNRKMSVKSTRRNEFTLDPDMIVDKKSSFSELRTDFKNGGTFGIVYGAKANTVSRFFNIPKDEGSIIIEVMKDSIPKTFEMVEEAAKIAIRDRYLQFNTRTNSGKHFLPFISGALSADQISKIEGEARNCKMQGTQADMVKEAIWKIDEEFTEKRVENCFLLQIHDELVWKHRGKENGEVISRVMADVGTLYLEGFTIMKAHGDTTTHWVK